MLSTLLCLFIVFRLVTADAWYYPPSSEASWSEVWRLGEVKELRWTSDTAAYNISLQQNLVNEGNGAFLIFAKGSGQTEINSMNWTVQQYNFDFSLGERFYFELVYPDPVEVSMMTSHYVNITADEPAGSTSTSTSASTVTVTATAKGGSSSNTVPLGVGIGIGLGVPLLLALGFIVHLVMFRRPMEGDKFAGDGENTARRDSEIHEAPDSQVTGA